MDAVQQVDEVLRQASGTGLTGLLVSLAPAKVLIDKETRRRVE